MQARNSYDLLDGRRAPARGAALVDSLGDARVSLNANSAAPTDSRVPLYNVFSYGALGVPLAAMGVILGVYLPRHYVALGVGFIAVSAAIFIVRVLDIAYDPLVALFMDRTKTPIGRYRPWILLGAPLVLLGLYMLLTPLHGVSSGYLILWSLVTAAGTSMMTLGLAAWGAVLAKAYNDRSRVYGWTQAMAVVGVIAMLLLPVLTHGKITAGAKASMPFIAMILIVAIPIALVITTLFTPERVVEIAQRPKFKLSDYGQALRRPSMLRLILADLALTLGPGTTGPLYVYYFHDAKGFTVAAVSLLLISYVGAGIFGAVFWGRVAGRFGKHRTVQIACVCYSITQATLMALPRV
ncbi:MAG: MFS transporter, partial [Caulobacteraceae bacterium]